MLFQNSPRLEVCINYTRLGSPSRFMSRPWLAQVCWTLTNCHGHSLKLVLTFKGCWFNTYQLRDVWRVRSRNSDRTWNHHGHSLKLLKVVDLTLTNCVMFGAFDQEIWIVDTLSSGQDFFSSHEHVVRVGVLGVVRVRHRVERTNGKRVFVLQSTNQFLNREVHCYTIIQWKYNSTITIKCKYMSPKQRVHSRAV